MKLQFAKYHGAGNDFIMVDNLADDPAIHSALDGESIARLCTRHLGIGADGLIQALPGEGEVPYTMGYFNADGTPAEMCGNGLRCLMQFLADLGEDVQEADEVRIMTGAGVVAARFVAPGRIQISMPRPSLKAADAAFAPGDPVLRRSLEVPGLARPITGTAVGVGNPHFVIHSSEMWEGSDVHEIGYRLSMMKDVFPEGVNVGFARKEGDSDLALVVYERGVGPTLACGSGAIAAVAAGLAEGRWEFDQTVRVRMPGGELKVIIGHEYTYAVLEGDATRVFTGEVEL